MFGMDEIPKGTSENDRSPKTGNIENLHFWQKQKKGRKEEKEGKEERKE